jgi:hypothetical protein
MSDLSIFILCAGVFAALIAPLAALDDAYDPIVRFQRAPRAGVRLSTRRLKRSRRRAVASTQPHYKQDRRRAA